MLHRGGGILIYIATAADSFYVSIEGGVDVSERDDGHPVLPRDLSGGEGNTSTMTAIDQYAEEMLNKLACIALNFLENH